jgi:hypothetical protein
MTGRARLSVVMAAPRGAVESESARLAFLAQLETSGGDELIVEKGDTGSLLVPELWSRGIQKSRGEIVALTLCSMIPDPGWAEALRATFQEGLAGVGGAIEPASQMRPLDWAIHLARYAGYLLPFPARDVDDLPGDNAAYRRDAIEACRTVWAEGFWETEVDAWLRRQGQRLRLTPEMVVRQGASLGFLRFCANRFRHGIRSGRERAEKFSLPGRLVWALAFPAAAAVILNRIRRLASSRGRAEGFRRALPLLPVFLLVWTAGEGIGYLRGR